MMRPMEKRIAAGLFALLLLAGTAAYAAEWTGYISDEGCAAKKGADPDHAACARSCIAAGEAAVLVAGGKIYKLDKQDEAKKFAGDKVVLKGTTTADGSAIKVETIRKAD